FLLPTPSLSYLLLKIALHIQKLSYHLLGHLLRQLLQYFYLNSWTFPPKIVCSTVSSSFKTKISASFPVFNKPFSSKLNSFACFTELILTASSILQPEKRIMLLKASLKVSTDPDKEPFS